MKGLCGNWYDTRNLPIARARRCVRIVPLITVWIVESGGGRSGARIGEPSAARRQAALVGHRGYGRVRYRVRGQRQGTREFEGEGCSSRALLLLEIHFISIHHRYLMLCNLHAVGERSSQRLSLESGRMGNAVLPARRPHSAAFHGGPVMAVATDAVDARGMGTAVFLAHRWGVLTHLALVRHQIPGSAWFTMRMPWRHFGQRGHPLSSLRRACVVQRPREGVVWCEGDRLPFGGQEFE